MTPSDTISFLEDFSSAIESALQSKSAKRGRGLCVKWNENKCLHVRCKFEQHLATEVGQGWIEESKWGTRWKPTSACCRFAVLETYVGKMIRFEAKKHKYLVIGRKKGVRRMQVVAVAMKLVAEIGKKFAWSHSKKSYFPIITAKIFFMFHVGIANLYLVSLDHSINRKIYRFR